MGGKPSTATTERYQPATATTERYQPATERYRPATATTTPERSAVLRTVAPEPYRPTRAPTSAPVLPLRNNQSSRDVRHPPPPELPQRMSLFDSPRTQPPLPPLPVRPNDYSSLPRQTGERRPVPQRQFANRPLPSLPTTSNDPPPPNRHQRFLDLEALLAGLDEIGPPESRRTSSSLSHHHHHHHHSRYRDRNLSSAADRSRRRDDDLPPPPVISFDDPLSFLRSLTRSRCCPDCSEYISIEDYQDHVSSCSKQPTIQYNEDTLKTEGGECSICLEDMNTGDQIARLPCLCVYHIVCIEDWFKVKSICPQHPDLNLLTD